MATKGTVFDSVLRGGARGTQGRSSVRVAANESGLIGMGEDRISDPWGARSPYRRGDEWPVRVDEMADGGVDEWVQSACVFCSHGCGVDIGVRAGASLGCVVVGSTA